MKISNDFLKFIFALIILILGGKVIAQKIEFSSNKIYLDNKAIEKDYLDSLLPSIKIKKLIIGDYNNYETFSFDNINQLKDVEEIEMGYIKVTLSDCILYGFKLDSFRNLEKISFDEYSEIPKELYQCKKLKEISVMFGEFCHGFDRTAFLELQHLTIVTVSINLDEVSLSNFYKLPLVKLYVAADNSNIDFSKINGERLRCLSLHGMSSINLLRFNPVKFKELEEFSFVSSNLERVPDSLFYLYNLKTVSLQNNKIRSIPQSISEAVLLEELQISENKLTNLPSFITKLSNLKRLDVRSNFIEEFPVDFIKMKKLVDFYVLIPEKLSKRDKGYLFIKDKMTWCTFHEQYWKNYLFMKAVFGNRDKW